MAMLDNDRLMTANERLQEALAAPVPGHEREWTENVELALAAVEESLSEHVAFAEGSTGLASMVHDPEVAILPTVTRKVQGLCRDHAALQGQASALRREAHKTSQAFAPADATLERGGAVRSSPGGGAVTDFGDFRRRSEQLIAALRRHNDAEAKLVVDAIHTDIGVGD
jgi:hypothetical protein